MKLLRCLPWRKPLSAAARGSRSAELPAERLPACPGADPAADALPPGAGCGWFDSSHDLQRGLQVQEHS